MSGQRVNIHLPTNIIIAGCLPTSLLVSVSQPARLNNGTTWLWSRCPAPIILTASRDDLFQIFFLTPPSLFSLYKPLKLSCLPGWSVFTATVGRSKKKSLYFFAASAQISCARSVGIDASFTFTVPHACCSSYRTCRGLSTTCPPVQKGP